MHYLGGKARIQKELSEYINNRLKKEQCYWSPFVGAAWIECKINPNRIKMASDIHCELISMWNELQKGWQPPQYVSEDEYYNIKNNCDNPALRSFVGFGCSWGGKYWGGYARDRTSDRNYAMNAYNSLMKKIPLLMDVDFFCADYQQFNPPQNSLIYCDPPYDGTTEYKHKFNSDKFWQWVRDMTTKKHTVLVSEYKAPADFTCVWSTNTKTDLGNKNNEKISRVEKLFEYIKGNN